MTEHPKIISLLKRRIETKSLQEAIVLKGKKMFSLETLEILLEEMFEEGEKQGEIEAINEIKKILQNMDEANFIYDYLTPHTGGSIRHAKINCVDVNRSLIDLKRDIEKRIELLENRKKKLDGK